MKAIIVLSALLAFAIAEHVCLPDVFTTDVVTFDPADKDIYAGRLWFSVPHKRSRHDFDVVIVDDKRQHQRASFLLDYTSHKFYEITYYNNQANCTIHTFSDPIAPPCLSKNAKHRGTFILGGVLKVDNYVEHVDNDKVAVDILLDANVNIPIRVVRRTPTKMAIDEYWNWKDEVHTDAFVVPDVCKTAAESSSRVTISEMYQKYN